MVKHLFSDIAGLEGGPDSINTYDTQGLTWGAGLGGLGTPRAMKMVADSAKQGGGRAVGAAVTDLLLQAGIGFGVSAKNKFDEFNVLDTSRPRIYRGANANQVIKSDPRLQMLLSHISRGELPGTDAGAKPEDKEFKETLRQEVFDKQVEYFRSKHFAGKDSAVAAVDQLGRVEGWPYDAICQVLHMQWGGVVLWRDFLPTKGDMKDIIKYAFTRYGAYVRNGNIATDILVTMVKDHGNKSSRDMWDTTLLDASALKPSEYYIEVPQGKDKPAKYRKLR